MLENTVIEVKSFTKMSRKEDLVSLAKKDPVIKSFLKLIHTHQLNAEASALLAKKIK